MEYTEASRLSAAARSFSVPTTDRKSTRLNSSHSQISYAVFCLKKKKKSPHRHTNYTLCALFSPPPLPPITSTKHHTRLPPTPPTLPNHILHSPQRAHLCSPPLL